MMASRAATRRRAQDSSILPISSAEGGPLTSHPDSLYGGGGIYMLRQPETTRHGSRLAALLLAGRWGGGRASLPAPGRPFRALHDSVERIARGDRDGAEPRDLVDGERADEVPAREE